MNALEQELMDKMIEITVRQPDARSRIREIAEFVDSVSQEFYAREDVRATEAQKVVQLRQP